MIQILTAQKKDVKYLNRDRFNALRGSFLSLAARQSRLAGSLAEPNSLGTRVNASGHAVKPTSNMIVKAKYKKKSDTF